MLWAASSSMTGMTCLKKPVLSQLHDIWALVGWLPHWLVGHVRPKPTTAVDCNPFLSISPCQSEMQSSFGIWEFQSRNSITSAIIRNQVAQREQILKETLHHNTSPHFIPFQKKFPPMYPDKAKREVSALSCHNSLAAFTSIPAQTFLKQVF